MPVSAILQKNFEWYRAHQDELVRQYDGKILVIVDCAIAGVFDTMAEAYNYALSKYLPGSFMIHTCGPGPENYTTTFYTPNIGAA